MDPIAFHDLRASFRKGQIHMTWQCPPSAPDTIHIFPCSDPAADLKLETNGHIVKNLSDCVNGFSFEGKRGLGSDVKKVSFCVYLAERNDNTPNERILQSSPNFFVSVITGGANIAYDMKKKAGGGGLSQYRIWVGSSAEIESGILGYSYYFYDREISVGFPGLIKAGITEYPPIYLINTAEPEIGIIGGSNADISVIRKKLSFWQRVLKSKKYSA